MEISDLKDELPEKSLQKALKCKKTGKYIKALYFAFMTSADSFWGLHIFLWGLVYTLNFFALWCVPLKLSKLFCNRFDQDFWNLTEFQLVSGVGQVNDAKFDLSVPSE